MSSLVRRLAIRMMKRSGYTREKWIVRFDPAGKPQLIKARRGGEITDRDDNPIGRHWPARLPADALPTKRLEATRPSIPHMSRRAPLHAPVGSRRGKRNKAYVARRKAMTS